MLVINLEVKDNHEEAAVGARQTLTLCQEVCYLMFLNSVTFIIDNFNLFALKLGQFGLYLILNCSSGSKFETSVN